MIERNVWIKYKKVVAVYQVVKIPDTIPRPRVWYRSKLLSSSLQPELQHTSNSWTFLTPVVFICTNQNMSTYILHNVYHESSHTVYSHDNFQLCVSYDKKLVREHWR